VRRKVVNAEDVLSSLESLGFESYARPLEQYASHIQEEVGGKKKERCEGDS
jgi:adenine-specific DNA glycosylase